MSDQIPDLSKWDNVTSDALEAPEDSPSDAEIDHKAESARKKAAQEHEQRDALFKVIARSLVGALFASVAVTFTYSISQWGGIDPLVIIGFNASVVVQVIGLSYIVARHLFPDGREDR